MLFVNIELPSIKCVTVSEIWGSDTLDFNKHHFHNVGVSFQWEKKFSSAKLVFCVG